METTIMWELRRAGSEKILDRFHCSSLKLANQWLMPLGFTRVNSFHWVHADGFNLKAITLVALMHLDLKTYT